MQLFLVNYVIARFSTCIDYIYSTEFSTPNDLLEGKALPAIWSVGSMYVELIFSDCKKYDYWVFDVVSWV